MSTLVGFYGDRARRTAGELGDSKNNSGKPAPILPSTILLQLLHRRVTILLSTRLEEVEGTLLKVDDERGDVFLEDAVHYKWSMKEMKGAQKVGEDKGKESVTALSDTAEIKQGAEEEQTLFVDCHGGGRRREIRRAKSLMIQSRYINVITPTLFGSTQ